MENINEFIQKNSPDGGFLQSENWRKFQEGFGHQTFSIIDENFRANIIEHKLPVVGKYFYIPRGPIISSFGAEIPNSKFQIPNKEQKTKVQIQKLVDLAKKKQAGWIRFDASGKEILDLIKNNTSNKIVKAPHDMQPREVFIVDISKSEEELLAQMKSKTRYNINLSQKRGVSVKVISNETLNSNDQKFKHYADEFLRLVKITAKRDGIKPHSDQYYRKMFELIPENILKLYIAEYDGKVIAANVVVFYANNAIYLHGASDNEKRNVMAPFLLQWRQIQDAKKVGCTKYDFGGVKKDKDNSWSGITRFKTGFSPNTKYTEFSGSYDIIISLMKYNIYKVMQKIRSIL